MNAIFIAIIIILTLSLFKAKLERGRLENALDWLSVDEEYIEFINNFSKRMDEKILNSYKHKNQEKIKAATKFRDSVALLKDWSKREAGSNFIQNYKYLYPPKDDD